MGVNPASSFSKSNLTELGRSDTAAAEVHPAIILSVSRDAIPMVRNFFIVKPPSHFSLFSGSFNQMREVSRFVGIRSENFRKRIQAAAADRNKTKNRTSQGEIAGSTAGMLLIPMSPGTSAGA